MKNWYRLLLIALVLTSCKRQFNSLVNFEISYEQNVTIQNSVGINLPFNLNTPPLETNAENEFRNQNTRSNLISGIYINLLKLEITDPSSEDFSFLERVNIYINAEGLPEARVAWKDPVPENTSNTLVLGL